MRIAKIYLPTKSAMQSGKGKTEKWVLEFVSQKSKYNPLMGWETSTDTLEEVVLKFPTKEKAIEYAWEFLVKICGLDKTRIYVTVFNGSDKDNISKDEETFNLWKSFLPDHNILYFDKDYNFWEMGDTGPCGPSTEIHYDNRNISEINKISGREIVNKNHPEVIEIWNIVFIKYNRSLAGRLSDLSTLYIDTGMGLERLAMIMQKKKSNYDIDIFQSIIKND